MLDHIKAVIFDLDGTIVDSMWMWRDIDIEYLARFGIEMPESLQSDIAGVSVTETAQYFKNTFAIADDIEKMISDWDEMAYEKYRYEVPLKDGFKAFVQYLREKGIPCAVATSNSRKLTGAVMDGHGLWDYFEEIITGEDIRRGKPAPDVYLECASRLGVAPEDCLVFEDIPNGLQAAISAGMKTCAVEDDFAASDRSLIRRMADYYIRSYKEIFEGTYEKLKTQGQTSVENMRR